MTEVRALQTDPKLQSLGFGIAFSEAPFLHWASTVAADTATEPGKGKHCKRAVKLRQAAAA